MAKFRKIKESFCGLENLGLSQLGRDNKGKSRLPSKELRSSSGSGAFHKLTKD